MFEYLPFYDYTPGQVALWFGAAVGVLFGVFAFISRFCLRRAIAGDASERGEAGATWLVALAVAVIGMQFAVNFTDLDLSGHRFLATDVPIVGAIVGGVLFGIGMVLARGCAARLTVLAGSGNLRAVLVMIVFAVVAHATLKGVLADARVALSAYTVPLSSATLWSSAPIWGAAVALAAAYAVYRFRPSVLTIISAVIIGLLVPLAWAGTGYVLQDEFDPIAVEGIAFTSPWTETLFYLVASSSVTPGFGVGLIGGVLAGAVAIALVTGKFQWQSFESPRSTGRYLSGAVLMGFGGVVAGGCTIGAGLAAIPMGSVLGVVALASIILGAKVTTLVLNTTVGAGASIPAE